MNGKPDLFVLSGKGGQKAYEHICNAKPLEKPLYTKADANKFESVLAPYIPDLIREMKVAEYR